MFRLPSFRGLGALADVRQSQLLVDLGLQVSTPIASGADKMPDVAKYEPALYAELAPELTALFDAQARLEQEINQLPLPVSETTAVMLEGRIVELGKRAEQFRTRVVEASRAGVEQKQLRTSILSVTVALAAVGTGWWIYSRSRGRGRRR